MSQILKSGRNMDYTSMSAINSMKLIELVRKQEVLYNSALPDYNDKLQKALIWEEVTRALLPAYANLDDITRELIRANVRRRWKTLRNAIAREVKRSSTQENYIRKKESPIILELEFLIPHIKSSHCAKLTEELRLRANNYDVNIANLNAPLDLSNSEERVNLTPIIRCIESAETEDDSLPLHIFYPSIEMRTDNLSDAHKEFYKKRPLNNSANEENSVHNSMDLTRANVTAHQTSALIAGVATKRKRSSSTDADDDDDASSLLLDELERRNSKDEEENDEERMFLLSLLSDLKRLPPAKKMKAKAEIMTVFAKIAK